MRIADIMSRNVELVSPDETIREAAGRMKKVDSGALPVGEGDRLVGMITGRGRDFSCKN